MLCNKSFKFLIRLQQACRTDMYLKMSGWLIPHYQLEMFTLWIEI